MYVYLFIYLFTVSYNNNNNKISIYFYFKKFINKFSAPYSNQGLRQRHRRFFFENHPEKQESCIQHTEFSIPLKQQ